MTNTLSKKEFVGKDDQYGYGMLNVTAAVMEAVERGSTIPDEIPTSLTPTNTSTNGSSGFTALISFISISACTIVTMVLMRKRK